MGRPPRLLLKFCDFQAPDFRFTEAQPSLERLDFVADTRCSASFAVLKERCLEMLRMRADHQAEVTQSIRLDLENLWSDLPMQFKLTSNLSASAESPFERDFLANQRLEYLHVHFLLGLALLQSTVDPDDTLLETAREVLSLVTEVVLLKTRLVNSGSHMLWKVRPHISSEAATCKAYS